jgi:hypothetical protein
MSNVPKSVNVLRDKYLSMKGKIARLNEKAGETIEGVVTTLEIQGAAFVFGAIQGAWFEPDPSKPDDKPGAHFFGMPVEAVFGVGLVVSGFVGLGGDKWSGHLINIGNGALAAWTSNLGRGWGFKFRKEQAAKKAGGSTKGESLREEIASLLDE